MASRSCCCVRSWVATTADPPSRFSPCSSVAGYPRGGIRQAWTAQLVTPSSGYRQGDHTLRPMQRLGSIAAVRGPHRLLHTLWEPERAGTWRKGADDHLDAPAAEHAPSRDDFAASYYTTAHLGGDDDYSSENERWRDFFMSVADRAIALTNPSSVLDVGCATGMLVQAFVTHGVEAEGIDVSEYAVSQRPRRRFGSPAGGVRHRAPLRPVGPRHLRRGARAHEPRRGADRHRQHLRRDRPWSCSPPLRPTSPRPRTSTRQPTADWAAWFAERGFFRRADANVSFLTPWAVLFERGDLTPTRSDPPLRVRADPVAERGPREAQRPARPQPAAARLQGDGRDPRAARRSLEDELAPTARAAPAPPRRLTTRDHIIGLEAENARLIKELGRAEWVVRRLQKRKKLQGQRIKQLRQQLDNRRQETRKLREQQADLRRRTAAADRELAEVRGSRSWRAGRALTAPLRVFRR